MSRIINLPQVQSTHTWLCDNAPALPHGTVVLTPCQTSGRGQRGNRWESAPGQNLTLSLLWHMHGFEARRQFEISRAFALGVARAVEQCAPPLQCLLKWPNDVYVADSKLGGILISHSLHGSGIEYSVLSLGLNVNQRAFRSDAPNPTSLALLTGHAYDLRQVLGTLLEHTGTALSALDTAAQAIHAEYMHRLWRADPRPHPFYDTATGERFHATVWAVEPSGHLVLRLHPCGTLRHYAFKEVAWR